MSSTLEWAQRAPARDRRQLAARTVGVLLSLAAVAGSFVLVHRPQVVDHVQINNDTGFNLDVDLVDADSISVIPLVVVGSHTTERVDDVIDVGRSWVFVLTREGDEVARVSRSRARLIAEGWRVRLPVSLESRLYELGQQPCTSC